ncbi:MAG: hypothetical protein OXT06_23730 [Rhodospirillaceae bacterium]|nr:hypothetical protein [Rhodospirillaceae bacterium]MDD9917902.1 hypothetical protein [Rhodospirillaceae bacterium]
MTEEAMMKRIAVISALAFALSPISAVYAQSAASVVTNATSDATTRAVTEAVQGATQDALKSSQKTESMKSRDMKAQAKKAGSAAKKRAN